MSEDFVVDVAPSSVILRELNDPLLVVLAPSDVTADESIDVILEQGHGSTLVEGPSTVSLQPGVVGLPGPEGPPGTGQDNNVFIQADQPVTDLDTYLWVELTPGGDMTFWIEDGA